MPFDRSTNPEYTKHELRGRQMIERGVEPKQLSQNRFEIPSQSKDLNYIYPSSKVHFLNPCSDEYLTIFLPILELIKNQLVGLHLFGI